MACPTARSTIIALATETAAALFLAGTYARREPAPHRPHLGRRGPLRRARRRDEPRRRRQFPRSLSAGAQPVPCRRRGRARRRRSTPSMSTSATATACARECEEARRDGFTGQDGDPSGAGRGHQRGVHADAASRSPRRSAVVAAFAAASRRRRRRDRRRDVRPPASCARGAIAGAREGGRASAADLKFLQQLQQARSGTSNRKAALES